MIKKLQLTIGFSLIFGPLLVPFIWVSCIAGWRPVLFAFGFMAGILIWFGTAGWLLSKGFGDD